MTTARKPTLIAAFLCTLAFAGAQTPSPARGTASKVVPLTPGVCAQISGDDVVSLNWNPAFEPSEAVLGLANFRLSFARAEEFNGPAAQPLRRTASLVLEAYSRSRSGRKPEDQPAIIAQSNGFFQILFQPNLRSVRPGTYNLIAAEAEPSVAPEFHGTAPHMSNNPTSSYFCIKVVAAPNADR